MTAVRDTSHHTVVRQPISKALFAERTGTYRRIGGLDRTHRVGAIYRRGA